MNETFDAGDEGHVQRGKTKAQLRRQQEMSYLKGILSTPAGKDFIWRLLGACGVYEESFTGNSTTFYKEGKRSIGLWVIKEINEADKNAYINMQKEALND